ncbi:MAG: PaaI family thioesterase [Myxococcaceae bacterium]|nr:PaaI family thioesterase [Myxococcaceae bacterium]
MTGRTAYPLPSAAALNRYREAFNQSGMIGHFGLRLEFPDVETVEVVLDPILPTQRGGLGTDAVNGGVLAAIFDLAIGCCGALYEPTRRSATVQLSIEFMRPVKGAKCRALAKIDRKGDVLLFASSKILDENEVTCATATGLIRMFKDPWSASLKPAVP